VVVAYLIPSTTASPQRHPDHKFNPFVNYSIASTNATLKLESIRLDGSFENLSVERRQSMFVEACQLFENTIM
jgi:hypothetical protein